MLILDVSEDDYVEQKLVELLRDNIVVKIVDCGIGSYEYFGEKGIDERKLPEICSENPIGIKVPEWLDYVERFSFSYSVGDDRLCITCKPYPIKDGILDLELEIN